MHVHMTILPSIFKDGHDPTRSQPGVCCETTATERNELLKHNMTLAEASPLMPQPVKEMLRFEALAGNHYNTTLRCGRDGIASPAGDLATLKANDTSFAEACGKGHRWIVLPAELGQELKESIAAWRNRDQNGNQGLTDGDLIRLSKLVVDSFLEKGQLGRTLSCPWVKLSRQPV